MAGYIAFEGTSQIDGKTPVALVLTGLGDHQSQNSKTGAMVQSWIVLRHQSALSAISTGADYAICGECNLRGDHGKGRRCYVSPATGLRWVSTHVLHEKYKPLPSPNLLKGRGLRMGTYGDPVALPLRAWKPLLRKVAYWTGYTHQWRHRRAQHFKDICMASVDTAAEAAEAQNQGWRTFRIRKVDPITGPESLNAGEIVCPASAEAGHRTTCAKCRLCAGASAKPHVAIIDHGRLARHRLERLGGQLHLPVL